MEVVAVWIAGALGIAALLVLWRSGATLRARFATTAAMIAAIALFPRAAAPRTERGPTITRESGYVGSGACRACHPSEHASWSRTFHRTMTQRGEAPVAITTGSHHMKGYWIEDDGVLHMRPVVWSYDEKRFLPRREAFLEPEGEPQHDVRWSSNCIACHATAGRPNLDAPGKRPAVAELGIACEACHGPGGEHAARERDPFTRYRGEAVAIVNPAKLPSARTSAVCGQCHAYAFPRDEEGFFKSGYADAFRPGDALEPSRILLTPQNIGTEVQLDTDTRNLFWPDGTVRVGGREYNAMILSACYLRGVRSKKITCLSCHSMHASDPNQQLRRDRSVQNACISCHEMPETHAHHAPGTPGSACVDCHMPKTSYALRRATRSHRIDSPSASSARPNACNLCHLDRSLAWTASKLAELWGATSAASSSTEPAAARGLLAADATERVIWADAFGEPGAIAASGSDWESPLLEAATRDPYAVIRFIASRSLARYPRAKRTVVDAAAIDALVSARDNREVHVAE
ncbi:MAG TPA: ammonia-forming cytochrome c nitrite reductase subunit c552 [Polyangiaceae bacterium]